MIIETAVCGWLLMVGSKVEGCYETFEQCKQQEKVCNDRYLVDFPCLCTMPVRKEQ